MYDFYIGPRPQTPSEEQNYLLSVKRLLPRWCNSIPDAQFLAVANILDGLGQRAQEKGEKLCLVETGVGASTLALVFYAAKYNGLACTWDFNSVKGSEMRRACVETICATFNVPISQIWKLVAYMSTSPYLGLSSMAEWTKNVHFTLHDSEHVWTNVEAELKEIDPFLTDGSVVAVDDAYYEYLHTDMAYINIQRKKLGLAPVEGPPNNLCEPHHKEVEKFLKQRWSNLASRSEDYRRVCRDDISVAYNGNELQLRSNLGMDKVKQLETRFAAFEVSGRIRR